jgi:hypothetical protein
LVMTYRYPIVAEGLEPLLPIGHDGVSASNADSLRAVGWQSCGSLHVRPECTEATLVTRGHPAEIHADISVRLQRTEPPRRTGRGACPLPTCRHQLRRLTPDTTAASAAVSSSQIGSTCAVVDAGISASPFFRGVAAAKCWPHGFIMRRWSDWESGPRSLFGFLRAEKSREWHSMPSKAGKCTQAKTYAEKSDLLLSSGVSQSLAFLTAEMQS